jgi:hypothetical protein
MYTTKTLAKAKAKLCPLQEYSFAFVCILRKRLQKQKQNFAQYWSAVLFCIYTTKTLAKAKLRPVLECSFAFVRILQKRLHKQEQNCAPTRDNDLQIAAIGTTERVPAGDTLRCL